MVTMCLQAMVNYLKRILKFNIKLAAYFILRLCFVEMVMILFKSKKVEIDKRYFFCLNEPHPKYWRSTEILPKLKTEMILIITMIKKITMREKIQGGIERRIVTVIGVIIIIKMIQERVQLFCIVEHPTPFNLISTFFH